MKEKNIEGTVESRVCFQELEDWVREKVQSWVQELLEEEVTELLGRDKSERRGKVDPASGYRNGYGKARRLTLSSGTITVRQWRVNAEQASKRTMRRPTRLLDRGRLIGLGK